MPPIEVLAAAPYNLFYALAVATAAWATFDAGRRRGWPGPAWALAVSAWVTGGVVGAMVPRLLLGDMVAARTSIGAVIVASLIMAAAAKLLHRSAAEVLDTTAIAIPLGASIVRIGCFLAECCQGLATSLPVGVRIHADDIPRHPVQLYEASLEIGLVAWLTRRALPARPGRQFATSLGALCAIRFVTEFLRDNDKTAGLSLAQWVVLPIAILCAMLLMSRSPVRAPQRALTAGARHATIGAVGALATAAFAIELPALETTVLMMVAAVAFAVVVRRLGLVAPAGLAAIVLQVPAVGTDSTYPRVLNFFGAGLTAGSWDAVHRLKNCEGTIDEEWSRRHRSVGSTLEFGSRRLKSATSAQGIRVKGYFDTDVVERAVVVRGTAPNPQGYTQHSAGVSVVGDFDWKYVGLSVGLSGGRFYPAVEQPDYGFDGRAKPFSAVPALGIRIGALRGLSTELRIGDESPMWVPVNVATMAVGIGDSAGNRLRLGISEGGFFFSARTHRKSGLEITPTFTVGGGGGDSDARDLIAGGIAFRKWFKAGPRSPAER